MPVLAIARLELFRLFGTKRGWVAMIAFLLIWLMVIRYAIYPAANFLGASGTESMASLVLDWFKFESLKLWPSAEISLYWVISLYVFPYFCIVAAADQIASDKARGTLRYITLRASRSTIFFGRFLGQALIQLLLIGITLATVVLMVMLRSPDRLGGSIASAPLLVTNVFLVLMPYIAMMSLVSVLAKSARQATTYAVIGWIIVSMVGGFIQSAYGPFGLIDWLMPGSQISALVKMSGWETMQLAPVPILHTAVLLGFGWWAMQRADL